jgi:hypothetical protein
MNRDELISQVKEHYEKLTSGENKQHIIQSTSELTPDAYYERLLDIVTDEIEAGTFDSFQSGDEIVNAVANNKDKWLPNWKERDHS